MMASGLVHCAPATSNNNDSLVLRSFSVFVQYLGFRCVASGELFIQHSQTNLSHLMAL